MVSSCERQPSEHCHCEILQEPNVLISTLPTQQQRDGIIQSDWMLLLFFIPFYLTKHDTRTFVVKSLEETYHLAGVGLIITAAETHRGPSSVTSYHCCG